MPLLSFVVPVYNAETTLVRCVTSLLNQSIRDVEIILVNDGSIDTSPNICDGFALKDSRVKVYHIANGGVSAARNYGLKHVTSEYVSFVDSDDEIDIDFCKNLSLMRKNDIIVVSYKNIDANGNCRNIQVSNPNNFWESFAESEDLYLINSPWSKIFKTKLIVENNITFNTNICYGEDHLFVLDYLIVAETIDYINGNGYIYYSGTPGSLVHRVIPIEMLQEYMVNCRNKHMRLLKKFCNNRSLYASFNRRYYMNLYYTIYNINTCCKTYKSYKHFVKESRSISGNYSLGLNFKQKTLVSMINNLPPIVSYNLFKFFMILKLR